MTRIDKARGGSVMDRYIIFDANGEVWASDSYDAFEEGAALMSAVALSDRARYEEQLGRGWQGDLIFCKEISRAR